MSTTTGCIYLVISINSDWLIDWLFDLKKLGIEKVRKNYWRIIGLLDHKDLDPRILEKHSYHNVIRFPGYKQVPLIKLRFKRYFSDHQTTEMIMSGAFQENMWALTETIKLGKKNLCNATN